MREPTIADTDEAQLTYTTDNYITEKVGTICSELSDRLKSLAFFVVLLKLFCVGFIGVVPTSSLNAQDSYRWRTGTVREVREGWGGSGRRGSFEFRHF